jgi:hypothetical protein
MYYSCRKNVNNQYLTNVFCVAFEHGLNLPVYQVNYKDEKEFGQTINCKDDAFILMICGNENHRSVGHYLEDSRVKMIIKNYPRMINQSEDPETSQEYTTKINQKGHQKFIIEDEPKNMLTIPLGICNNFNPVSSKLNRTSGGFIGQWTQFRQQKFENIRNGFINASEDCPYDFAFYNGFGPFVQRNTDSVKENKGSLRTEVYSNFMSNADIAFIPSGQSPETYRLFEAAAAGCIIVHDVLPDIWYYDSLPYVPLESTDFMPVKDYIDNYTDELRLLTSIWWQSVVCPIAVGKKIASTVKELGI